MPSPPCTALLTDHHTLMLATFVDHTEARNTIRQAESPSSVFL